MDTVGKIVDAENCALSLFDMPDGGLASGKLDVVQAEFLNAQTMSWEELFDGYNSLCAITYSSSVDFICRLLKKFDRAEIIFGFQDIMSYNLQEIMAYQIKTIECLRDGASRSKLD
ncbi:MAG: hypothetical protein LBU66_06890, partial [Treponema sp.]|nr:hypothetical protein [Treponema sp.]